MFHLFSHLSFLFPAMFCIPFPYPCISLFSNFLPLYCVILNTIQTLSFPSILFMFVPSFFCLNLHSSLSSYVIQIYFVLKFCFIHLVLYSKGPYSYRTLFSFFFIISLILILDFISYSYSISYSDFISYSNSICYSDSISYSNSISYSDIISYSDSISYFWFYFLFWFFVIL